MKLTRDEASNALALLTRFGNPHAAAHDCDVTLTSIRPYTCRMVSNMGAALRMLGRHEGTPKYEETLAKLRAIAEPAEVTP